MAGQHELHPLFVRVVQNDIRSAHKSASLHSLRGLVDAIESTRGAHAPGHRNLQAVNLFYDWLLSRNRLTADGSAPFLSVWSLSTPFDLPTQDASVRTRSSAFKSLDATAGLALDVLLSKPLLIASVYLCLPHSSHVQVSRSTFFCIHPALLIKR